jgi:ribosomal protein S18 acetylase RimI-like enzyme
MTASLSPPEICPVAVAPDAPELQLAAQAWPNDERPAQLSAVQRQVAAGCANDFVLLAAHRGRELRGAVLAQRLPGRVAVVWPPQLTAGEEAATCALLLQRLLESLRGADVHLAQVLVENAAEGERELLCAAGFQRAGELVYMAAAADCFPADPPSLPLALETYSPHNHDRLLRVIEATYRGSLDCPLIDGLRETQDVLAGYRAAGQFRPELWLLARASGNDAGCLLLADHPAAEQWEIVYLGIVPEYRGRGWGLALTRHAQWLARRAGRARLVLAVDAANRPAIEAYRAAGFVSWDRRSLLVHALRPTESHDAHGT